MSPNAPSVGSSWTEACWAKSGTGGWGPCPAASAKPAPRPAPQPGQSWSDRLRADGKGEAACGSGMCSPYLWLPCNPGEGITPEFAFLSLLLTLCPGWSLILAGSEVPVNQAAGTSRGPESRRARPTTCPGSPGKVGELQAPPGVPEWLREVVGKGWGGPVLLLCAELGTWDLGQGLLEAVWGPEVAASAQKGASSRSSQPHHDCPHGRKESPRRRWERQGGRENVPAQTAGFVVGERRDLSVLR